MSETPKSQSFHFGIINGSVNAGGTVDTQKSTQNNYSQDPVFDQTLIEIRQFLERSQHKEEMKSNADQNIEIIDVYFEQLDTKDPEKWKRWMTCLDVAFAGGVETAKVLNPWAGIPIEVLKRLYEVYQESRKRQS